MPNTVYNFDEGLGSAVSPEQWAQFVLDHLSHESVVLASGARRVDTHSKLIHIPRLTDDGSVDWFAELEEITTDSPAGDDLVLTPKKVAALTLLSNEVVLDSDPAALNVVGQAMLRAIAIEIDRAIFHGAGGTAPLGILETSTTTGFTPLPDQAGPVGYEALVRAAGQVSAAGGRPDVAYIHPTDHVALQLAAGGDDRPLITGDASQGAPPVVAGLRLYITPALEAGEALVAQADQVVVAIRRDASVEFSSDYAFERDGTAARVIARVDAGVNDSGGLCHIQTGS